jgi:hypothetical protein
MFFEKVCIGICYILIHCIFKCKCKFFVFHMGYASQRGFMLEGDMIRTVHQRLLIFLVFYIMILLI